MPAGDVAPQCPVASLRGNLNVRHQSDPSTVIPTPRVYGLFDMSIFVNIDGHEVTPYLAEVRPEHEGKTFELDIFDMGDNEVDTEAWIEILHPNGDVVDCSWTSNNAANESAPTGPCRIDIANQRFNGAWLRMEISLDNYSCDETAPSRIRMLVEDQDPQRGPGPRPNHLDCTNHPAIPYDWFREVVMNMFSNRERGADLVEFALVVTHCPSSGHRHPRSRRRLS